MVSLLVTLAIGAASSVAEVPPVAVDEAAEGALPAVLGDNFSSVRSDHFVLAHDADQATAARVLAWLEDTYDQVVHFRYRYALPISPLQRHLEVVCSRNWSAYKHLDNPRLGQVTVYSGYYDEARGRCYFGLSPSDLRRRSASLADELERLTVQHEVAHQLIDGLCPSLGANMPPWLSEGLACAFEVAPEAGVDAYRSANRWRARDATDQLGVVRTRSASGQPNVARLDPDSKNDSRTSFTDVVTMAWDVQPGGTWTPAQRYGMAWAVVFYLQTERAAAFKTYLHRLTRQSNRLTHAEQVRVFRDVFGPVDGTMDRAIHDVLRRVLDGTGDCNEPASDNARNAPPGSSDHLPSHQP